MKKILLKLSGEILRGKKAEGICQETCIRLAHTLKTWQKTGHHISLVIGGGNIIRGIHAHEIGLPRVQADQMGMLATLINGLSLQAMLEKEGCPAQVFSAVECPRFVETFTQSHAREAFEEGKILIFVGGTGNPYFSTDTAAALRSSEMGVDLLLKATKVDGIYSKDPVKNPDAKKYTTLSYTQILAEKLAIMDATSIALCQGNQIPIVVFNMALLLQEVPPSLDLIEQQGTRVNGG